MRRGLSVPGKVASFLMILLTLLWTFWGFGEMYHEGWWGAWYNRLAYMAPVALTMGPTLIAFRWPRAGGVLILALGVFVALFFGSAVAIIGGVIALVGAAFLFDGIVDRGRDDAASGGWWGRHWRHALLFGPALAIALGVSANMLPVVLSRQDDGIRTARRIDGNGVSLVWAPEGPGWNWRQPWGGYPSWHQVALYGVEPAGLADRPGYDDADRFATAADMRATNLCLFLSEDGSRLLDEAQSIWRMPTADELTRSLVHHGGNAGCAWGGALGPMPCPLRPDKESPLWAADAPAIYYWAADEHDERAGVFVSYNGYVNAAYKKGGNPRHSYRCVRDR